MSFFIFVLLLLTMFEFFGAKAYHICACHSAVIFRAIKSLYSQIFSAFFKAYEMSTNQISRSYHEGIPSY